ncbi:uncharacterized protein LOC144756318 isoform X1 [Lissotriton helveticus]
MLVMLNDPIFYKKVTKNPTERVIKSIQKLTTQALNNNIITKKEHEYLNKSERKIACIYGTPKMHKNVENPPYRPIVSTIGTPTEALSKYLDNILRPYIQFAPSYIKYTGAIVAKVEHLPFDNRKDLLVTLDVEALYSNIPQKGAIEATSWFIDMHKIPCDKLFVLNCLSVVLEENVFQFGEHMYQQTKGVSMGAAMAPSIANIYMAKFEYHHIHNEMAPFYESVSHWYRFIDDIFFIWTNGEQTLKQFLEWINLADSNLRFTAHIDSVKVEFLDIYIKNESNKLIVDLYTKTTARNTLLHFSSYHPRNQKDGIPFSQFLRVRRNCTSIRDYDNQAEKMKEKFLARGYPNRLIREAYKRARYFDRDALLNSNKQQTEQKLVCITKHSPLNETVRQIINSNWHLLNVEPTQPKISKPMFAHRRNKNLKDIVVRSRFSGTTNNVPFIQKSLNGENAIKGTSRCGSCQSCDGIITGETFTFNKVVIRAQELWTCNTTNIVYLLLCPCNLGYVGETARTMKVRLTEHRSAIKTNKLTAPLVSHFIDFQHSPSQIRWRILEKIHMTCKNGGDKIRKKREVFWIFNLDTFIHGLNNDLPWINAIL